MEVHPELEIDADVLRLVLEQRSSFSVVTLRGKRMLVELKLRSSTGRGPITPEELQEACRAGMAARFVK